MRDYTDKDSDYIEKALLDEGFTLEQMTYKTDQTFITDVGFFSYRVENRYPRLVHFYLDKKNRGAGAFRKLSHALWEKMIEKKHLFCVLELPKEKPYLKRFIKYYGGKDPFCEKDGDKFYYIPTFGRIRG